MDKKDKREPEEEYDLYEDGSMLLFSLAFGLLMVLLVFIISTALLRTM